VKTEYKHIYFTKDRTQPKSRKTEVWECYNHAQQDFLGVIKWSGAWRQYCWFQEPDIIMAASCMVDVIEVINNLMDARKAAR